MQYASPKARVIVTHCRSWQALCAIRSLGRHGVDVVAADEYPLTPGGISRYATDRFLYPSPVRAPEAFLETLCRAVEKYRPSDPLAAYVLMPVHSETCLIAQHADRFRGSIALALACPEAFRMLGHKGHFSHFARELGMAVPPVWFPRDAVELESMLREIELPVFVKHPRGLAGVGVIQTKTIAETLEAFERLRASCGGPDSPLVQAAVEGDDYCTTALCDRGRLRVALTYRNVCAYPPRCGPGVIRETVHAPVLTAHTRRIARAAGWHGFLEVDFRWTGSVHDRPYVLEVNPRFCSGVPHALHSGIDYPWLAFRLAAERRLDDSECHPRIRIGARTQIPVVGTLAKFSALVRAVLAGKRIVSSDIISRVRTVWGENRRNESILLDRRDWRPILGLFYPLAVLLRHGSISRARVVGAEMPMASIPDDVAADPSARAFRSRAVRNA